MKALVAVTFVSVLLPLGVVYDHTRVTLTDATGTEQSKDIDPLVGTVEFEVVNPGDGSVKVQAIDSTGAPLGLSAEGFFTIPQPTAEFLQPATVLVTLSA